MRDKWRDRYVAGEADRGEAWGRIGMKREKHEAGVVRGGRGMWRCSVWRERDVAV